MTQTDTEVHYFPKLDELERIASYLTSSTLCQLSSRVEERPLRTRRIVTAENLFAARKAAKARQPSETIYDHLDIIAPAPRSLTVEVNGACNLSCKMCPRATENLERLRKRNREIMPLELFQRYVSEAFPLSDYQRISTFENAAVVLYIQNEPLLDSSLDRKAGFVRDKGLGCIVSSNLSVNRSKLEFLASESGVSKLICSINAVTEETYNKINQGGQFNLVKENLEFLAKNKPASLDVIAQILVLSSNEHEVDDFVRYVKELGIKPQVKSLNTYSKTLSSDLLPVESEVSRYRQLTKWASQAACARLWRGPTIDVFGNMYLCCTSGYTKGGFIQQVRDSNVQDCWNSENMQRIRYAMLKKGLGFNRLCADCDSVLQFSDSWKGAGV